jgi:hypothetical protein
MLGFNGGLMGQRRVPITSGAPGVWFSNEQSIAKRAGIWPSYIPDPGGFSPSPSYTLAGESAFGTTSTNPSSFGFYFGTTTGVQLNGLGFASQAGWGSGTTYAVKLWSIENGGSTPEDYTELAGATFVHGNTYTLQNGYFWQSVSPVVSLPDSSLSDGYVITAIGNFSGSGGNVQFQGGTATFDARFVNGGNGFNNATDESGFYPIPYVDGAIGSTGYFNANFSCVPA